MKADYGIDAPEVIRNLLLAGGSGLFADMRALPFPEPSFDVVVSYAAIHNLATREDRAKAVTEIGRVLVPGGVILIRDVRSVAEYVRVLHALNFEIRQVGAPWKSLLVLLFTWGALRPGTIVARAAGRHAG